MLNSHDITLSIGAGKTFGTRVSEKYLRIPGLIACICFVVSPQRGDIISIGTPLDCSCLELRHVEIGATIQSNAREDADENSEKIRSAA
jgi:hypothetical protein